MIFLALIALVFGFYILIKGADWTIESSSLIAKRLGVPTIVIGLTLVAFGTSLPELAVSVSSSIRAALIDVNADIALGNVIGSNITNLTLILGTSALLTPLVIPKSIKKNDMPFLLMISVVFLIFLAQFGEQTILFRFEGIILLIFFVYYLYLLSKEKKVIHDIETHEMSVIKSWALLLLGFSSVALGGYVVTFASEYLSTALLVDVFQFNPEKVTTLVGLTIVAFGTSLPELVTSVIAIKKGEHDIAIGNVIGSNMFNILLVTGLSATIVPLGVTSDLILDASIMLVITLFVLSYIKRIKRPHKLFGFLLLAMYLSYTVFIILRTI